MTEFEFLQNGLQDQQPYIQMVQSIMEVRARGPQPLAFVHTYGCQQNVSDGEKIKGMLQQMGYGFTDSRKMPT